MPSSRLLLPLLLTTSLFMAGCDLVLPPTGLAPTREALVDKYPNVEEVGGVREENVKILCPFQRMLERSGIYDLPIAGLGALTPSVSDVKHASEVFGCATNACGVVAHLISVEQSGSGIDLERLHDAGSTSHDCGLTFDLNGTEVSDAARLTTLNRLFQLADAEGKLIYANLLTAKTEICAAQGVTMSKAGETEIKLIFSYLGGVENGSIAHSDVEKLLNATMPIIKTSQWITADLLDQIK
ncbi:MAG: hypothetical protein HRU20_28310 [Pseudomonadales bacterium]|nr:hypothetical protein [Pseudomonadales bacterium]